MIQLEKIGQVIRDLRACEGMSGVKPSPEVMGDAVRFIAEMALRMEAQRVALIAARRMIQDDRDHHARMKRETGAHDALLSQIDLAMKWGEA